MFQTISSAMFQAKPDSAESNQDEPAQHAAEARAPGCRIAAAGLLASILSLLSACSSPPAPTPMPPSARPAPPVVHKPQPTPPVSVIPAPPSGPAASNASTARAYRHDAASHIYAQNRNRIYPGRLPPMLYAVGVMEVDLDARGRVLATHWLRAPRHAPEVMAEIERTVRQAAPYPVPTRLGKLSYTDVWLWHESGRFQLDTLTEGQD